VSPARCNAQYSFKTTRLKTFGSHLVLQHYRVIQMHGEILTLQHYRVVQKHVYILSYWNITMLFTSSVTYWHIAALPCYSNARWNSDVTALPCSSKARLHAVILEHYRVFHKLGDVLTYCNITSLYRSSVSVWHIAILPHYSKARCRTDILQNYRVMQKFGVMLTYCNTRITPLFKRSVIPS